MPLVPSQGVDLQLEPVNLGSVCVCLIAVILGVLGPPLLGPRALNHGLVVVADVCMPRLEWKVFMFFFFGEYYGPVL